MKTFVIVLAILAILGAGGWYLLHQRTAVAAVAPIPTAKIERGHIRLAVTSTGKVVSNLDVDIKCKASGEIVKLPYDISDMVKKDALLVELDPIDEQRQVKLATASLDASQAKLAQSRQSLLIAEQNLVTARQRAQANQASADARAKDAQAKAGRLRELLDKKLASQEDYDTAQTTAAQANADLETARAQIADLKAQELALDLRKKDIDLAQAQVESDQISLANSQQRLSDTKVVAPIDGVVSARNVQIGTIISSGITNVGGGTTVLTLSDLSRVFVLASVDESDIGRLMTGSSGSHSRRGPGTRPSTLPAISDRTGDAPATQPIVTTAAIADTQPAGARVEIQPPVPAQTAPPLPVEITADAYPGVRFTGQVVRIATKGVNTSNIVTFEVKVEILSRNKDLLRPEMTANVDIIIAEKNEVLVAPMNAVIRKKGQLSAMMVKPDGGVEERPVEAGINDGVNYEITSGLADGDTVQLSKSEADSKWRGNPQMSRTFTGGGGGGRGPR
ncbi:MAG TPA: efflux RND transporter periplasmic adaptor subunit [Tepidisphaeraceae bacterium]